MPNHLVKQGECLSSIAAQYRFAWEQLWNLPQNRELRLKRKNPNILFPGDGRFLRFFFA